MPTVYMQHRALPPMKQFVIVALLAIFDVAPVCTQTPTPSEGQIQWQLAEHDRLQRWHQMIAKWETNASLFLVRTNMPRLSTESRAALVKLLRDIRNDMRQIRDEAERIKLEAQLRGLPAPPSTTEELLNPIWNAAGDIRKKIAKRFPELQRDSRW